MQSSIAGVGTKTVHVDLTSLMVAAPRAQAAPLATNSSITLGAVSGGGLSCNCLQCQASAAGSSGGSVTLAGTSRTAAGALPVDYTDSIKKSGRKSVDALLAGGNRWFHTAGASGELPSAVAKKTITYSFIDSAAGLNTTDASGFQALSSDQRDRVRDAVEYLSSIIDVDFTEVASGGDIRYGSNSQANSGGYARYPNEGSQVFIANNQSGFGSEWDEGSYNWQILLHETGHALGLKHPGNYNAGGGGTPGPYLSSAVDNRGNTLMSYKDAKNMTRIQYNNGAFTKTQVNASTFQAYDIAALQYLYGASTTVDARSYSWDAGEKFSNTLWNPNAGSEINLVNQTGSNVVDLRAGKYSSIGVVDPYSDMPYDKAGYAALKSGGKTLSSLLGKPTYTGEKNLLIAAGSQFTRAIGGSGSDSLVANTIGGQIDGGGGDDKLFWSGGNLQAVGGNGTDILLLKKVSGAVWAVDANGSSATLTKTNAKTKVVTTLATVTMSGIESVRYWNGSAMKATGATLYAAAASPSFSATA